MLRRQVSNDEADTEAGKGGKAETLPIRRPVTQQKIRHLPPLAEAFFHRKSSPTGTKLDAASGVGKVEPDSLPTTSTPSVPEDRCIDHGTSTATTSLGSDSHQRLKTRHKSRTNVFGNPLLDRASAQVAVPEEATRAWMTLAQEDLEEEGVGTEYRGMCLIHPMDWRYRYWWVLTVIAACFTGFITPFRLAFNTSTTFTTIGTGDGWSVLDLIILIIFSTDILISFVLGYYTDRGELVMDHRAIAAHYAKRRLFVDLLTTIPWDAVALEAASHPEDSLEGKLISLLGLLKLGRMYRLIIMFRNMTYNLEFSLLVTTLTRNAAFVFYLLHFAACGFYFIAAMYGKGPNTWVGANAELFDKDNALESYVYSFYWAIVTFDTLGYGDLHPYDFAEVVFVIVFVAVNLVVWAYILGSITLLVTRGDEDTGRYRERMQSLLQYCKTNRLPQDVMNSMKKLLKLNMSMSLDSVSDEAVLAAYPTTVRRRILRMLYKKPLEICYLFHDCGDKFFDALMMGARVELFLPKVEIVSSMDHVNEIYVIVAGFVEIVQQSQNRPSVGGATASAHAALPTLPSSPSKSNAGGGPDLHAKGPLGKVWAVVKGRKKTGDVFGRGLAQEPLHQGAVDEWGIPLVTLGPGNVFAEVSYFTEVPKPEAIRAYTSCRVLVISRAQYNAVASDFPISARQVLENLKNRAEELVNESLPESYRQPLSVRHSRGLSPRSSLTRGPSVGGRDSPTKGSWEAVGAPPLIHAPGELRRLNHVQSEPDGMVADVVAPGDGVAAAAANGGGVGLQRSGTLTRQVPAKRLLLSTLSMPMQRGSPAPGSPRRGKLDARSSRSTEGQGVVSASSTGRQSSSIGLQSSHSIAEEAEEGADGEAGMSAEQARAIEDLTRLKQLVQKAVAKMDASRTEALLHAAAADDVDTVQTLLQQGMKVDTKDYDGRTPIMIAAANGKKETVLALLFRGASLKVKDIRGTSVLLAAVQAGHTEVVELLIRNGAQLEMDSLMQAAMLCKVVFEGNMEQLRLLLKAGADPDAIDYDRQTALHIAAADGNLPATKLLVEEGHARLDIEDRWGRTPLDVAHKVGAGLLVDYMEARVTAEAAQRARLRAKQKRTDDMLNACHWGDTTVVQRLLDKGVSPDVADYDGKTALFVATVNGQEGVVSQLLAAGADPNKTNSTGSNPLLEAALLCKDSILNLLLQAGARLNQPDIEQSALLSTIIHQHKHELLKRLLLAGANPAAPDYDRRTPLHIAAGIGDLESLQIIADAEDNPDTAILQSVDWDVVDRWGHTPLQEALKNKDNNVDIVNLLKQRRQLMGQPRQQQQWGASSSSGSTTRAPSHRGLSQH